MDETLESSINKKILSHKEKDLNAKKEKFLSKLQKS